MKKIVTILMLVVFVLSISTVSADNRVISLESVLRSNGYDIENFESFQVEETKMVVRKDGIEKNKASRALVCYPYSKDDMPVYVFAYNKELETIIPNNVNSRAPIFFTNGIYIITSPNYTVNTNSINGWNFYRNYKASFSWTSADSTVSVSKISVEYYTGGAKYYYPSCLSESWPTPFDSGTHFVRGSKTYPSEGTTYYTGTSYPSYALGSSYNSGSGMGISVTSNVGSWSDDAPASPSF